MGYQVQHQILRRWSTHYLLWLCFCKRVHGYFGIRIGASVGFECLCAEKEIRLDGIYGLGLGCLGRGCSPTGAVERFSCLVCIRSGFLGFLQFLIGLCSVWKSFLIELNKFTFCKDVRQYFQNLCEVIIYYFIVFN